MQESYLFICAFGESRSPTAAEVMVKLARTRSMDIRAAYIGIDALNEKIGDPGLYLDSFNRIFVMEKYMQERLVNEHQVKSSKIECLDIKDIYYHNEPELVDMLFEKLKSKIQG